MATNLFRKTQSLYASTANTFSTGDSETITPASVSGLPTDTEITLTFDRVDSGGTETPTKMERIIGVVTGGNFVSRVTTGRGADGSTEQAHTSPVVEYIPNAKDFNDSIDGLLVEHNQDGTHDDTVVTTLTATQTLTNKTLTSPTLASTGYLYRQTVYFTSTGNFAKADYSWLRAIRVRLVGGGGGGGGIAKVSGEAGVAGCGGGGGYSEEFITDIAGMDATVTVTVGAGGAGAAAGENDGVAGVTTSFGAYLQATGGALGVAATSSSSAPRSGSVCGAGGVGSNGDLNISGDAGSFGIITTAAGVQSGSGGRSFLSGNTLTEYTNNLSKAGVAGKLYGGGGGGAIGGGNSIINQAGGAGADGIVIVELYQ